MEQQENPGIALDLTDEVAEGAYSNLAVVMHSQSEFVLDFARMSPNTTRAKVYSRVIMSPDNAKRLLRTLQDNVARYEADMGEIRILDEDFPDDSRDLILPLMHPKGEA